MPRSAEQSWLSRDNDQNTIARQSPEAQVTTCLLRTRSLYEVRKEQEAYDDQVYLIPDTFSGCSVRQQHIGTTIKAF